MIRASRLAVIIALPVVLAESAVAGDSPAGEETTPAARPARAISPHMAEVLMAAMPRPKYAVTPVPPKPAAEPADAGTDAKKDPLVVELPKVVVTDSKLPTEALTRRAVEEMAMNHYLGSKGGLDRGILNRFTVAEYWPKIPIIGKIIPVPKDYVTNEERAMQRYYEDERLRKMNDLLDLASLTTRSGNRELGEQIKRETNRAFIRRPGQ